MTEEEWKEEIRRRDEIIDSLKGVELDFLFLDTKIRAIKCIVESEASGQERLKMIRALIIYG